MPLPTNPVLFKTADEAMHTLPQTTGSSHRVAETSCWAESEGPIPYQIGDEETRERWAKKAGEPVGYGRAGRASSNMEGWDRRVHPP